MTAALAARNSQCGTWCDGRHDVEPHDEHIAVHGTVPTVRRGDGDRDLVESGDVSIWVERTDDGEPLMVAQLWDRCCRRMTSSHTVEQAERFAELVLFWVACIRGVEVDRADAMAVDAAKAFRVAVAAEVAA